MEISTRKALLSYTIGIMFILLLLYRTHHPSFSYLISYSPEIICTVILLATLVRYGGRAKNDEEGKWVVEGEIDNKPEVQREGNYYFEKDEHAMKLDGDDQTKEVSRSLSSNRDGKSESQESSNNDEDDERNVMELRVCEVGRFQRLESLIEKRRLRKLQRYETEKNLIDIDSYYHMASIPSISAPRRTLFDSDGNYKNSPMPSSAPSFLQRRPNPFDLPVEQKDAVGILSNEYLSHHDFLPAATKWSMSICTRQTNLGVTDEDKPEIEKLDSEEAKRLAYRRQLSRRSKSKLRYNKILSPTNTGTTHIEQGPQVDSANNQNNESRTETNNNNVSTLISVEETHQAANVSGATLKEEFVQVQKLRGSDTQIPEANIEEGYNQDLNEKDSSLNVHEDSTASMAILNDESTELQRADDAQVADPVSYNTQNPEANIEQGYSQVSNKNNDSYLKVVEDSTTSMAILKDVYTEFQRNDDTQVADPVSSDTQNPEANTEEVYNQDSNKNDSSLNILEDSTTSMAILKDDSTVLERVDDAQVADPVSFDTQNPEANIEEEGYSQDSNEKESSLSVDVDDDSTTSMAIPKDESTESQRHDDDQVAIPVSSSDTQTPETNTEEIYNQNSYEKDSCLNVDEDPSTSVEILEDEWVEVQRIDDAHVADSVDSSNSSILALGSPCF